MRTQFKGTRAAQAGFFSGVYSNVGRGIARTIVDADVVQENGIGCAALKIEEELKLDEHFLASKGFQVDNFFAPLLTGIWAKRYIRIGLSGSSGRQRLNRGYVVGCSTSETRGVIFEKTCSKVFPQSLDAEIFISAKVLQ